MANEVAGISNRQFNPPDTLTKTSHSFSILFNGVRIGLINGWNPVQSRAVAPIYELNVETSGLPYENIPGNMSGLNIQIARYDLWVQRLEQVFARGQSPFDMLSNQKTPFTVVEEWLKPDGSVEAWEYLGCWFTTLGRNISSGDARVVNVNASLIYLYKRGA